MIEKDGNVCVDDELTIPLLQKAVDMGINFFDTHWFYCKKDSQRAVGVALKSMRNKVYISTKIMLNLIHCADDFDKYLHLALEQMGLDYLDFYHLPALSYGIWKEKILPLKLLDRAESAKSKGLIKHLSFSFHSDTHKMPELIDSGAFSTVLGQYNIIDRSNEEIFSYAKLKGLGTMVMSPLMGGVLTDGGDNLLRRLESNASSAAEMSLRFIWGLPTIDIILSGMSDIKQLTENVEYANRSTTITMDERQAIIDRCHTLTALNNLYCTNCNYCAVCPENVLIGDVFQLYTQHSVWGLSDSVRKRIHRGITQGWKQKQIGGTDPSVCIECGVCISHCPQNINIPNELKRVWDILKNL